MNQNAPKFIGKRISVRRGNKELVITVDQKIERWKEALLIAWISAWTFCGIMFIFYLFRSTNNMERLFFIVITSIWLFFLVRITKVFLWRIAGKEIIVLKPGTLSIQNAFWNRGKVQVFNMRNIFKLGLIRKSSTNFLAYLDDSFWIMGGDKVGFSYSGTKIQFGKQLNPKDAEILLRTVDFGIKEFGKLQS